MRIKEQMVKFLSSVEFREALIESRFDGDSDAFMSFVREKFLDTFIKDLEDIDVVIKFKDGYNLVALAPKGVLTEEIMEGLNEYKVEILKKIMHRYWGNAYDISGNELVH